MYPLIQLLLPLRWWIERKKASFSPFRCALFGKLYCFSLSASFCICSWFAALRHHRLHFWKQLETEINKLEGLAKATYKQTCCDCFSLILLKHCHHLSSFSVKTKIVFLNCFFRLLCPFTLCWYSWSPESYQAFLTCYSSLLFFTLTMVAEQYFRRLTFSFFSFFQCFYFWLLTALWSIVGKKWRRKKCTR